MTQMILRIFSDATSEMSEDARLQSSNFLVEKKAQMIFFVQEKLCPS